MLIGVDVGGTFTDVIAIENGEIRTAKVSTDVHSTEKGVLEGARELNVENATRAAGLVHTGVHAGDGVVDRTALTACERGQQAGGDHCSSTDEARGPGA